MPLCQLPRIYFSNLTIPLHFLWNLTISAFDNTFTFYKTADKALVTYNFILQIEEEKTYSFISVFFNSIYFFFVLLYSMLNISGRKLQGKRLWDFNLLKISRFRFKHFSFK